MKKAEPRKLRKAAKPLGDDDLFGDSGDIFSDIPSKPKDKKKKKSSTVANKEDIFAGGGGCRFVFCACHISVVVQLVKYLYALQHFILDLIITLC